MTSLFTEGWPVFGAIALVTVIAYGALRPHLKGRPPAKETEKDIPDER